MDLSDKTVLVAGLGISGRSMMEVLRSRAARVIGVDEHKPEADLHSFDDIDWDSADIVMTSPVFNPRTPFILEAQRRGIPVYSEVELAWRLRVDSARTGRPAPWVGITGTNGKTSTTEMTSAMLCADGLVAPAVGNIGKAVSHAAVDPDNDALCVELSSFQLHFTDSLALDCAAITNIADDHLDWHGGIEAYAADKSKVFRNVRRALVFNADDRRVSALASAAHTAEGCRRIGFTLGVPQPGQIGVDDGWIVDRSGVAGGAFGDETRLAPVQEFPHLCEPDGTVYPHLLADAMTALALALGMGVDLDKALAALKAFAPGGHRIQTVATAATGDGGSIRFIDDSKATNAHAVLSRTGGCSSVPAATKPSGASSSANGPSASARVAPLCSRQWARCAGLKNGGRIRQATPARSAARSQISASQPLFRARASSGTCRARNCSARASTSRHSWA